MARPAIKDEFSDLPVSRQRKYLLRKEMIAYPGRLSKSCAHVALLSYSQSGAVGLSIGS